ncbi:Vegetative incompatibility protein HET-E-1 [Fusarium oxysporum f. sp. raphani]|nr:Vegetative incompatibility protein HET-E-1 [Fusarium oxysporum f. sp. raphani]
MNSRRTLLESEKSSATLDGIQLLLDRISEDREKQARDIRQINKQNHGRRVSEFRDKLQTADYQTDHEISTKDRSGASGDWIFNNDKFQTWHDKSLPNHGILYVNGKPGAGKTTLTSAIIEKLLDNRDYSITHHCVLYFYFKHQVPGKSTFNGLLRAILEQLIDQDQCMSDHLFEKASSTQGVTLRTTNTLQKIIKDSLESYHICYIVLDGLDECTRDEAVNVVNWFLSLTSGKSDNSATRIRVLFSGQRDGVLDNLLASQPSIELEMSGHIKDIRQYCQKLCGMIQKKFDLEPDKARAIADRIVTESEGMFLYARVVLENLRDQTSRYRLEQELNENILPLGAEKIEKAYERVAIRVFEQVSKAELEDATKILGWVICGRRHIRWREIQAFFCIDPSICDVDYEGRRLRVTCKDLCRSFVDIHQAGTKIGHPEDLIKIVHSTAQE